MRNVDVLLHRDFAIGVTDRRLFGAFVEHLGRCVYGGIYEPGHPTADEQGFREDVLALVRELAPTIMRYPGGNFVSGYNWEDGVGPVGEPAAPARPRLDVDRAQPVRHQRVHGLVPARRYRADAGGQPRHARRRCCAQTWSSIATIPAGRRCPICAARMAGNKPHDVKFWCLGNEMDGPWQMESKTAVEYGRIATEAAKMMKWIDPSIELAACGSSGRNMPTFGAWEDTVLEHTFDHVEFISLHTYINNYADDTPAFLGEPAT